MAILLPNGEQWLSLFYGAALIGAVTVPVNTRFKAAEIDFCLKQSGAKALFYVDRFLNIDYGAMVQGDWLRICVDVSERSSSGEDEYTQSRSNPRTFCSSSSRPAPPRIRRA